MKSGVCLLLGLLLFQFPTFKVLSINAQNVTENDLGGIPLYISGMFSMTNGWDGSGALPAVELALEQINERTDILEGYHLKLIWNDSECVAGKAPRILFDQIQNEPTKLIILGPACSPNTQAVAVAAHYWNLLTVSYSASSPSLSNRVKYPYFYRTVPQANAIHSPPLVWFMKNYGWKKVAIIYENDEVFQKIAEDLMSRIMEMNGTFVTEIIDKEAKNQIENLKAYRIGLYGPSVFWTMPGWYESQWWRIFDGKMACTVKEVAEAVELSPIVGIDVAPISYINRKTVAGITPSEFSAIMEERISTWPKYENLTQNNYMAFAFDAMWSIGLMLNKTSARLGEGEIRGPAKRLEDFTYDDTGRDLGKMFFDELAETNFFGASGSVHFTEGERIGNSLITQLKGSCPTGWTFSTRHCYKFVGTVVSWERAKNECSKNDSYLFMMTQNKDIVTLSKLWRYSDKSMPQWHVDGNVKNERNDHQRNDIESSDMSSTNSPFPKTTNESSEDCTYADFQSREEVLKTGDCDAFKPFICQRDADFQVVDVAVYDAYEDEMTWTNDIDWPGGVVPTDGLEEDIIEVHGREELLSSEIHILFGILSAVGILLSLSVVIFTKFSLARRLKTVTSRNLIQILHVGFIIMLASIPLTKSELLLSLSDEINLFLCQSKVYLASIGYVLVVSTMIARTWKTYSVYVLKAQNVIKDWGIYLFIATSLLVDGLCLFMIHQFFPYHISEITLETKEIPSNETLTFQRHFEKICIPEDVLKSTALLLCNKICLLLAGSYISYEIREVKAGLLDDSKAFSWSIYNLFFCTVCGCLLTFLLRDDSKNLFIFTSSLLLVYCGVTIVMISAPKLWILLSKQQLQNITASLEKQFGDSNVDEVDRRTSETLREFNELYNKIPVTLMNENMRLRRQLDDLRQRLTEVNVGNQQEPGLQSKETDYSTELSNL